jgi:hypothetical protein
MFLKGKKLVIRLVGHWLMDGCPAKMEWWIEVEVATNNNTEASRYSACNELRGEKMRE